MRVIYEISLGPTPTSPVVWDKRSIRLAYTPGSIPDGAFNFTLELNPAPGQSVSRLLQAISFSKGQLLELQDVIARALIDSREQGQSQ